MHIVSKFQIFIHIFTVIKLKNKTKPRNAVCRRMGTCGWYHYFGVESSIIRTLSVLQFKHIPEKLKLFKMSMVFKHRRVQMERYGRY